MKTLSKLISILFLGISIIFLLYTLYRSELIHQETRFDYYLKYYLFGIFLIILSIISFFIDKEMKIDTCIILFSSMLGLYVVEGYFFLNSAHYQVLKSDIKFDVRTKLEIYQDLKKNDPNVVVSVSPDSYLNEKKQFFVTKMDITQFIKVIGMVLITQIMCGTKKRTTFCY